MANKKNAGTPANYGRWDTPPVSTVKVTHVPEANKKAIARITGQNAKKNSPKKK